MVVGIATIDPGNRARAGASSTSSRPSRNGDRTTGSPQRAVREARPGIRQPPVPSLTDVSATTQTARLFTVTGRDFTAGGRVYLAIYDQMGARLYETRWITASPPMLAVRGRAVTRQRPSPGLARRHAARGVRQPLRGDGDDAGLRLEHDDLEHLADGRTRLCGLRRAPQRPALAPGRFRAERPKRGVTDPQREVTRNAKPGTSKTASPGS